MRLFHRTLQNDWEYLVHHFKLNWTFLSPFPYHSEMAQNARKSQKKIIYEKENSGGTAHKGHTEYKEKPYNRNRCERWGGEDGRCRKQQERWGWEKDVISGMCNNFYWTALWMNEHMIIIHKRPVNTSNNWNIESSIVGRTEQLHGAHIRTRFRVPLCFRVCHFNGKSIFT